MLLKEYGDQNFGFIICKIIDEPIFEKIYTILRDKFKKTFVRFIMSKKGINDNNEKYKKYSPFGYSHKICDNTLFIPTKHYHNNSKNWNNEQIIDDWNHNIYI